MSIVGADELCKVAHGRKARHWHVLKWVLRSLIVLPDVHLKLLCTDNEVSAFLKAHLVVSHVKSFTGWRPFVNAHNLEHVVMRVLIAFVT